jgi:hypothetical protein
LRYIKTSNNDKSGNKPDKITKAIENVSIFKNAYIKLTEIFKQILKKYYKYIPKNEIYIEYISPDNHKFQFGEEYHPKYTTGIKLDNKSKLFKISSIYPTNNYSKPYGRDGPEIEIEIENEGSTIEIKHVNMLCINKNEPLDLKLNYKNDNIENIDNIEVHKIYGENEGNDFFNNTIAEKIIEDFDKYLPKPEGYDKQYVLLLISLPPTDDSNEKYAYLYCPKSVAIQYNNSDTTGPAPSGVTDPSQNNPFKTDHIIYVKAVANMLLNIYKEIDKKDENSTLKKIDEQLKKINGGND